jgi:CRP-like cAMP-binding protein
MSNRVTPTRDSKGFELNNRLLAALPSRDLQSPQPHLEAARLASGSVLFEVDEPLTNLYFVETGVVSLLTASENPVTIGMATVGR